LLGPGGLLARKTVILVTHSMEFTKNATVIHVMEGGKIVDRGTYEELVERSSVFSEIKRELEEIQKKRSNSEEPSIKRHKKPKTVMFEPPQPSTSRQLESALSSIWLSHWADANVKETNSRSTLRGLVIFIALGFGT
ncbi:hypothetical protein OSTOST_20679, partial [Ostertagia ostertagi]